MGRKKKTVNRNDSAGGTNNNGILMIRKKAPKERNSKAYLDILGTDTDDECEGSKNDDQKDSTDLTDHIDAEQIHQEAY
jgi:hypothetical protein